MEQIIPSQGLSSQQHTLAASNSNPSISSNNRGLLKAKFSQFLFQNLSLGSHTMAQMSASINTNPAIMNALSQVFIPLSSGQPHVGSNITPKAPKKDSKKKKSSNTTPPQKI